MTFLTNSTIKTAIYQSFYLLKSLSFKLQSQLFEPTPFNYNFMHKALVFLFNTPTGLRDFLLTTFLSMTLSMIFWFSSSVFSLALKKLIKYYSKNNHFKQFTNQIIITITITIKKHTSLVFLCFSRPYRKSNGATTQSEVFALARPLDSVINKCYNNKLSEKNTM